MLKLWRKNRGNSRAASLLNQAAVAVLEPLESRQLLHGGFGGDGGGGGPAGFGPHGFGGGAGRPGGPPGSGGQTIALSLTPSVVQTGLDALAKADGLADPASTARVELGNANGVETYSITIDGTGTVSRLTVDQLGNPVTAPTHTTTTWAILDGTGAGSDSAAAAEISAIATAKSLTAPTSTTTVNVTNTSAGAVTYSVNLNSSAAAAATSTQYWHGLGTTITVDSAGNPVGNQQLPFSVFSGTIRSALNKNAPAGATALASDSTQTVDVRTTDGVTTYSVTFTVTGTTTTVTVDATGALTSLPTQTTTTFSALSSKLQSELQTLATADGVATTIAGSQTINVLTETNGTVIYSATLSATGTGSSGNSYTFDVTIAVDSNGNPTTLPRGGGGFSGDFGGGFSGLQNGSSGCINPVGPTQNGSSGSTNSNSSSAALTASTVGSALPTASTAASAVITGTSNAVIAKLLADSDFALASVGGYLAEFASLNTAGISDLTALASDIGKLATDTRALTTAQRKTLATDTKGIATAIKAMKSTLSPLETTIKNDAVRWAKSLRADHVAIKKDKKNATALAAAQTQLTDDEAAALQSIANDASAILTAISGDTGVVTAQAKLTTDLPTIGTDESTIRAAQRKLLTDLQA